MTDPVRIHPTGTDEERLWRLARDVGDMLADLPWLLIGGLMVRILEVEHGRTSTSWTTTDVDAVLDVRAVSVATEEAARRLQKAGFEPEYGEDGVVYRFIRGADIVDVLASLVELSRGCSHDRPPACSTGGLLSGRAVWPAELSSTCPCTPVSPSQRPSPDRPT